MVLGSVGVTTDVTLGGPRIIGPVGHLVGQGQRRISTSELEQRVVGAALDDPTALQNDHLIGIRQRRESVGDGQRRPTTSESRQGTLQFAFGVIVEGAGRLVEHEDRGSRRRVRAIDSRCLSPPEKR